MLSAGHVPTILLIFIIQGLMVRELFALAVEVRKEKDVPWFRLQQWYFYGTAVFFTYGRFLKHKWLESSIAKDPERLGAFGLFMFAHHSFISYIGWMVGLVLFVLSLRSRGLYLYQFGQFAWTHMIIVTVLMQSSCFVANVLEGMIWFVFPVSIVFFNDAAAYMCGFFFGRTPLIKISPKKTWEGFIGGLIVTLIVTPFAAAWMQQYEWLICPVDDKSPLRLFGGASGCDVDPLFIPKEVPVASIVGGFESTLGWMVPHGWIATVARALFGWRLSGRRGSRCTPSCLPRLRASSRRSEASSRRDSRGRSRSRTSATPFLDTVGSPTGWIVRWSWLFSRTCTSRTSSGSQV